MWGICVIISGKLQDRILKELHQSYSGIAKTESLASIILMHKLRI